MTFFLVSLVSMLILLGILVLVHEFGHFAVAKLCGVRVETFSIGFGTRLFGFRYGDTDYRISLLPLGGYVKMAGEVGGEPSIVTGSDIRRATTQSNAEELPAEKTSADSGDLSSRPRWQRILIAVAGPMANFVLALLLMTALYVGHNEVPNYLRAPAVIDYVLPNSAAAAAGLQAGDHIVRFDEIQNPDWQQIMLRAVLNLNHSVPVVAQKDGQRKDTLLHLKSPLDPDDFTLQDAGLTPFEQTGPLKVAMVEPGMPGAKAGLKAGDAIVSVDGTALHSLPSIIVYLQQNGGRPVTLQLLRNGKPLELTVQPQQTVGSNGQPDYKIGFATEPSPSHIERLSLPEAFSQSVHEFAKQSTFVADVLHRVVTNRMSVRTLSGPVGIARETGHIVSLPGWTPVMSETASISLQLGLLNLLPIPILDGGVILMLLIESIMRHDLNEHFKERVYQGAFVFFVLLMVFILFNDLAKIPSFAKLKL